MYQFIRPKERRQEKSEKDYIQATPQPDNRQTRSYNTASALSYEDGVDAGKDCAKNRAIKLADRSTT